MNYLVIEIQKNSDGTIGNLVFVYDNINAAESKYHTILAAAAVSSVAVHSAVLLNETGYHVKHESYNHLPAPVNEPEPESGDEPEVV